MNAYSFSVMVDGIRYSSTDLEDKLHEVGCDDGLIHAHGNYVAIDFDREAESLESAVLSAIENIENAGIGARVSSINESIYVSLSDIAKLTGITRQAISLYFKGKRNKLINDEFPIPTHNLSSRNTLWRWSEVANWLTRNGKLAQIAADNACMLERLNLALLLRKPEDCEKSFQAYWQRFRKVD